MAKYRMDIFKPGRKPGHPAPLLWRRRDIYAADDATAIAEAEALYYTHASDRALTNFYLCDGVGRSIYQSAKKEPQYRAVSPVQIPETRQLSAKSTVAGTARVSMIASGEPCVGTKCPGKTVYQHTPPTHACGRQSGRAADARLLGCHHRRGLSGRLPPGQITGTSASPSGFPLIGAPAREEPATTGPPGCQPGPARTISALAGSAQRHMHPHPPRKLIIRAHPLGAFCVRDGRPSRRWGSVARPGICILPL